jgi:glycerol-3-phosphate dehydrogenase (NAD(P)+)
MSRICILGSGAWGTALALSFARNGHEVALWSHSTHVSQLIREKHENTAYLPGFAIPSSIRSTADAPSALDGAEIVVSTMPSEHVRAIYTALAPLMKPQQILVSATKGIEDDTHLRMSQVIAQLVSKDEVGQGFSPDGPQPSRFDTAALSGPSFASEVAAGMPTALTIACTNSAIAERLQQTFSSKSLRVYTNEDIIGVELGGALKNVIAIATGIAAGLKLGHNAMAALITRGIAEVTRLSVACGGRSETLAGLSGVGDLVLTCTGSLSRNRTVGIALGQGRTLEEILHSLGGKVAEGVRTTPAALGLARKHGVEMPITEQMDAILREGKDPKDAMRDLMSRPGRDE